MDAHQSKRIEQWRVYSFVPSYDFQPTKKDESKLKWNNRNPSRLQSGRHPRGPDKKKEFQTGESPH